MKRHSLLLLLIAALSLLTSCEKDEAQKMYSTKNRVYCNFYVPTYTQLFNAMGNFGQFVTIRQTTKNGASVIQMTSSIGTDYYAIDATMKYFSYGLGGLIVGTSTYAEPLAYDLSCPNCDRVDRRLSVKDDGTAVCAKCKITYDLNSYGYILTKPDDCIHENPRGLYRYRIMYDGGSNVSIYN